MLEYAIFIVTFVVLAAVIYFYTGLSKASSIPGLEPRTKEDGNLADINRSGSLHEFLLDLHKQFDSIASFWMGQIFVVSIHSPELFKQHQNVFDKPHQLFKLFEPFLGAQSIQYANGSDGRNRRNNYDKLLSHHALKRYYEHFHTVSDEIQKKWSTMIKQEHIPLSQYMFAFALKVVLKSLFGKAFDDDKEVLNFRRNFDICWGEMERSITGSAEPGSPRQKAFDDAAVKLKDAIKAVVQYRRENPPKDNEELLIDVLIDTCTEDRLLCDSITFVVGGYHSTGNFLTWCFYFLATHQDIQDKVYEEIESQLGNDDVDFNNINDLKYTRQVLDETLRCAVVAPWAARLQEFDSELDGHKIPKGTPVIHALGVSFKDEKYWPFPNKFHYSFMDIYKQVKFRTAIVIVNIKGIDKRFDPDRFSPENVKSRPTMAFQPYGFAGKRICPAYRFAYAEATVCLVKLLRKFKVNMVEGQVVKPVYGFVGTPEEEIWITIEKR